MQRAGLESGEFCASKPSSAAAADWRQRSRHAPGRCTNAASAPCSNANPSWLVPVGSSRSVCITRSRSRVTNFRWPREFVAARVPSSPPGHWYSSVFGRDPRLASALLLTLAGANASEGCKWLCSTTPSMPRPGSSNPAAHADVTRAKPSIGPRFSGEAQFARSWTSGVMRALFPQDATRRAFLKAVGASTALAAIAQFLPARRRDRGASRRRRPGEEGPQGRLHPDHLRDADHHGAPDGLLRQAGPQRRSHQDRRLGGHSRQDHQQGIRRRAHALADAARDHAWASARTRFPTRCRRSRTSTARRSRSP